MKRQAEGKVKTSPLQRGESQKKRDVTVLNLTRKTEKSQNEWDRYTELGLSIFPVKRNKKPAGLWKHLQKRYPTAAEIAQWKRTRHGIAIVTGKRSNLVVVDADSPQASAELESVLPEGFCGPIVRTPAGGKHYYCLYSPSLPKNDANLGASKKIDIRSEGGYVVAPPTYAKYEKPEDSGNWIEGTYEWERNFSSTTSIFAVPKEWIYLFTKQRLEGAMKLPPLTVGSRNNAIFCRTCTYIEEHPGCSREQVDEYAVDLGTKCVDENGRPAILPKEECLTTARSAWKHIAEHTEEETPQTEEGRQIAIPLISFDDIQEERLEWHVPHIYAKGMIHAVGGLQGHGKSLHFMDLAAKTSVGGIWPITGTRIPKGDVIYITDEDSPKSIMKPRLRLAGADMRRIFIPDFNVANLILPGGMEMLRAWIAQPADTKLLFIDPLADYSKGDLNQVDAAIKIITPLKQLADSTGVVLVYSVHFNKKPDLKDVQRVAHSYVLTSKPRLVWLITKKDDADDADPDRLFVCGKTAFKPIPNMMFTIGEDNFENPFIERWSQDSIQTVDALGTSDERRDFRIKEAEDFLMRVLPADGSPMKRDDLWRRAEEEKIAQATFYRAARGLKNIKKEKDEDGTLVWSLESRRKSHRPREATPDYQEKDPLSREEQLLRMKKKLKNPKIPAGGEKS